MTQEKSPKTTLSYGSRKPLDTAATLVDKRPRGDVALGDTLDAPAAPPRGTVDGFVRTTVLPRSEAAPAAGAASAAEQRFEQLEIIGAGGMGEVSLAEDHDIQRKVAVKRLRADLRGGPALARFAEEVRIIGQLEHPNITPVHDVGIDEQGQHYFVMKFVDGETLEAIIAKLATGAPGYAERYGVDERVEIFVGILNAVRYAHARGIIHRDLKPANIMVGRYGEVTVVDWGIAMKRGSSDGAGVLVGTPLYMSPEQAGGAPQLDERSDIFSLCMVLLELLTLRHPLRDKPSLEAVLAALVTGGVDHGVIKLKLDLARAGAPADYGPLLARGLQHDPARRFASVDELEAALRDIREGKAPVSCHITLTKRAAGELVRFVDRWPILFTLLFLGVVALVGAGAWLGLGRLLR